MSRWRDFLNEEVRLSTIDGLLAKISKEARRLSRKNEILQKKISILEEDRNL
jgi:hypothetical protein